MLWFFAIAWWFFETRYFGWNATAGSPEEMICDGIVFVLVALALVDHRAERRSRPRPEMKE